MKLFYALDRIATKFEVIALNKDVNNADWVKDQAANAAKDIRAEMEKLASAWGSLSVAIKRLEKGE